MTTETGTTRAASTRPPSVRPTGASAGHRPSNGEPRPVPLWRQVAIPAEHGGWSLTAEPIVLGLLVEWSWSGCALGVAVMLAFTARTPIKVVLVDRWRGRWLERTALAARVAAAELTIIAALVVLAGLSAANGWFWVPLAAAAPLWAIELWFDMRSRSRRLVPELAGAVGIGASATAIVIAGGGATGLAIGLWVIVAVRAVASIVYIRAQIDRFRGQPGPRWPSDLVQLGAVGAVAVVAALDLVPWAPVGAMVVVALVGLVGLRRSPQRPMALGLQQLFLGVAVIVVTAVSVGVTT